jgi:hypothetical protein
MPCRSHLMFPAGHVPPAVAAMGIWDPARERGWALRGLSKYHIADVGRLVHQSDQLLARSRRIRSKLSP